MRFVSFTVLATLGASGCATLLKDQHQSVTVTSMTPGSPIFVDGMQVALTPARISLSTKRDHVITVRGQAGEHSCRLESSASIGWVILGIVASPAWLVDLVTGSWRSLEITECTLPGLAPVIS
jgi:hypothetical protein